MASRSRSLESGRGESAVAQGQIDLFLDRLVDAPIKDDQALMEFPFFSLEKRPRKKPFVYKDGDVSIRIEPSHDGMANIWDKDLLMYIASIVNEKIEKGEPVSPVVRFAVHDFLKATGRSTGKTGYDKFTATVGRLLGTVIKTTIESAGATDASGFGWIKSYRVHKRTTSTGKRVSGYAELELNDWMFRALVRERRVLTVNPAYFKITGGLERRIYELARKHTGGRRPWEIGIGRLQQKCGSTSTLARFKHRLKEVADRDAIPDFGLTVHEAVEDTSQFAMTFRRGATVVEIYPKGAALTDAAGAPSLPPPSGAPALVIPDGPKAGSVDPDDLRPGLLSSDTYEAARSQFPGWDIYALELEWIEFTQKKGTRLRNPESAYLAFCRSFVQKRPSQTF